MEYNDYELVYYAKENNEEALELLYKKYKPIIIKYSVWAISHINHHGAEIDDLIQEGWVAFNQAINNFEQDSNASFYTFANLCIKRKLLNYIKRNLGKKDKILNNAISINDELINNAPNQILVDDELIYQELENEVKKILKIRLSDYELKVLSLKRKGYTLPEISVILKKEIKSIYNTFGRIKNKTKTIINTVLYD